jgi:hypothetical protein
MFEAGRSNLFALSSNKTFPVSREVTLIPTIAEDNSGFAKISDIRRCNSARFLLGFELSCGTLAGVGDASGVGDGLG